ncbi:MAG: XRE family transcriptional regulator [Verrucomicrobiaceae bacterium]|nr:MAG: XRE family transcriptional regulator [Verrucomicrobiaceae bacterium]
MKNAAATLSAFGRNLSRLRTGRGVTQEQLAESADIHPRYLQKLEGGKAHPSLVVLTRLRSSLRCEWNDLLQGL